MKTLIWILALLNLYLGARSFLNVIHVLDDSKYAQGTTAVFAILFLGMGLAGLYLLLVKHSPKQALAIQVGPWIIALVILLFVMLTSDYK